MSFPDVSDAFWGLMDTQVFQQVSKEPVDFEVLETIGQPSRFNGIIQPLNPQRLAVKPEGQRQWKWWTLWTQTTLPLDYLFQDQLGKFYRVMSVADWSGGQYQQYDVVEGPIEP